MKSTYLLKIICVVTLLLFFDLCLYSQHFIEITDGPLAGTKMEVKVAWYKKYCELPTGMEHNARFCSRKYGVNPEGADQDMGLSDGEVGVCYRGGGIDYDVKAENIFNSGGIAMLVINLDINEPDEAMLMSGYTRPDPDFWGLSLSLNSGILLEDNNITSFKFRILAVEDNSQDEIIWENGAFDGGIGSWTTTGISCGDPLQDPAIALWKYDEDGEVVLNDNMSSTIASVTACNGAMYFNSQFYDTNNGTAGEGECLATHKSELISPDIDISGLLPSDPITLKFSQCVYHNLSNYFIAWSNDGGINWIEEEINQDFESGGFYQNEVRLRLNGAIPTSQFKVKLIYHGNYIFWIVDDIKLIKEESFLAVIDENWVTSAPYPTVPLSLVEPIQFMTNVENVSDQNLTGTVLKVTVSDDLGEEVYVTAKEVTSAGQTPGNLLKGDKIENIILGDFLPQEVGNYTIKYEVSSIENNWDDELNSVLKTFTVTSAVFGDWGREDGITGNISMDFDSNERVDWAYSNLFKIGHNTEGVSPYVSFHVVNAGEMGQIGATAQFYIYECQDLNNDNIYTKDEYEVVGYNYYDFRPGDPDNLTLSMPILELNSTEEIIPGINPDKVYILSLVYQAPLTSPDSKLYWGMSDKTNQKAIEYMTLQNGSYQATHEAHTPWTIDGPIDCSPQRPVFEGTPVPYARFNYMSLSSINPPLNKNTFNIWPTNVKADLSIKLDIANKSGTTIEIFDISGNKIGYRKAENEPNNLIKISVENFVQGTYFVKVTTAEGSLSKPFNVIK